MYLIHARLRAPSDTTGSVLPVDAAARALDTARAEEAVEHVSAHPRAVPDPVLGFFVLADSLAQAEERVARVCGRLLGEHAGLRGWTLVRAEAPLLAPMGQGLLGPGGSPSAGPERRRK
ncbi:hypothetical protein ACN20G_36540 (plasmid) [Streptomyces sp. BI20]|uniref:hypothetical protein n=1 Tax=Streptomyces sp. BI20 TaxID=3403460 RepID=UPI003C722C8A